MFKVYRAEITDLWMKGHNVCIPVSLEVRHRNLCGVADRGSALRMAGVVPGLERKLGQFIMRSKNNIGFVCERVIAFFTKPGEGKFEQCIPEEVSRYSWGETIPGSHCIADPVLIERSARQLLRLVIKEHLKYVFLPVPGLDSGQLGMDDVEAALEVLKDSSKVRLISDCDIDDPCAEMHDIEELI